MDKIKSFSVCDMENGGLWCDIERGRDLLGRKEEFWGFSYSRSIGGMRRLGRVGPWTFPRLRFSLWPTPSLQGGGVLGNSVGQDGHRPPVAARRPEGRRPGGRRPTRAETREALGPPGFSSPQLGAPTRSPRGDRLLAFLSDHGAEGTPRGLRASVVGGRRPRLEPWAFRAGTSALPRRPGPRRAQAPSVREEWRFLPPPRASASSGPSQRGSRVPVPPSARTQASDTPGLFKWGRTGKEEECPGPPGQGAPVRASPAGLLRFSLGV